MTKRTLKASCRPKMPSLGPKTRNTLTHQKARTTVRATNPASKASKEINVVKTRIQAKVDKNTTKTALKAWKIVKRILF